MRAHALCARASRIGYSFFKSHAKSKGNSKVCIDTGTLSLPYLHCKVYIFYEQLKVYLERENILPQLTEAMNKETVFCCNVI